MNFLFRLDVRYHEFINLNRLIEAKLDEVSSTALLFDITKGKTKELS